MTRRVVTCNSWREAAADECDEFFTKLIGWAVLLALGFGAVALFSNNTPSAPASANTTPQQPSQTSQTSSTPPAEDSHEAELAVASPNTAPAPSEPTQTCWFVPGSDGYLQPESCTVSKRINANGHTVYDVTDSARQHQAVVLWDNNAVEVIQDGVVSNGSWKTDEHGRIRVDLEGRSFVYPPV